MNQKMAGKNGHKNIMKITKKKFAGEKCTKGGPKEWRAVPKLKCKKENT